MIEKREIKHNGKVVGYMKLDLSNKTIYLVDKEEFDRYGFGASYKLENISDINGTRYYVGVSDNFKLLEPYEDLSVIRLISLNDDLDRSIIYVQMSIHLHMLTQFTKFSSTGEAILMNIACDNKLQRYYHVSSPNWMNVKDPICDIMRKIKKPIYSRIIYNGESFPTLKVYNDIYVGIKNDLGRLIWVIKENVESSLEKYK